MHKSFHEVKTGANLCGIALFFLFFFLMLRLSYFSSILNLTDDTLPFNLGMYGSHSISLFTLDGIIYFNVIIFNVFIHKTNFTKVLMSSSWVTKQLYFLIHVSKSFHNVIVIMVISTQNYLLETISTGNQ